MVGKAREQVFSLMVFRPDFRIDNTGDRSTTVSKAELLFKIKDKEYTASTEVTSTINAHSTVHVRPEIYSYDETIKALPEQGVIGCVFTLFHTHGKETLESTSEMVM